MLQTIRDKVSGWVARLLLGALVLVFVFWGIELRSISTAGNSAAEVNGEQIKLTTLQNAWRQRQAELQQVFKSELPESLKKQQQEAVLQQLIRAQLLQQRAASQGFRVSDTAIAEMLFGLESLKVDGRFSRDRYASLLLQQGMTEAQFESQLRSELATRQLQNGIVGTAFMTSKELQRAQSLLGEQREIDYVVMPAKAFANSVKVSDSDVMSWYESHKAEYLTPETVDLQYVELRLADSVAEVTADDAALRAHYEQIKDRFSSTERRHGHHILITTGKDMNDAAAKRLAEELLAKLQAGGDFEALAKQYSKDPGSANKGGDLGWATKGMFVGAFEDALFGMKAGELRGPVKTEFGYHILRLDEIEGGSSKPFEQVRAEVEADYKADRARSLFYDRTQKLADAAFAKLTELDSVAKDFATTVKTISGFTRNGGGEFGADPQVIEAAFSEPVLEKGENSPLVTLGEDRALVLRVVDHKLPQQKPVDQVRNDILVTLTEQATKAAAEKQVKESIAQLKAGALPWSAMNKTLLASPAGKKWLGRNAAGVPQPVLNAAFVVPKSDVATDKPAYASAALTNGDYAAIAISGVQSGTATADASAVLAQVREQRVSKLGAAEFSLYMSELERTADIKRNPAAFE
ncbi:MAG: SurA N-terminal domain-containing protein [Steroidobacteraceae bacterium]